MQFYGKEVQRSLQLAWLRVTEHVKGKSSSGELFTLMLKPLAGLLGKSTNLKINLVPDKNVFLYQLQKVEGLGVAKLSIGMLTAKHQSLRNINSVNRILVDKLSLSVV